MTGNKIMAVVVSHNGDILTQRTVRALLRSVDHIHIVDNGSDSRSLSLIKEFDGDNRISLSLLTENKGLGYALNIGVGEAKARGYEWLLTMDQDSLIDEAMVASFLETIHQNERLNMEVSCLSPNLSVNGTRVAQVRNGEASYAITSGNLVRVELFNVVGLYDEGLFIDCIDFDFSLRVRRAGYKIVKVGSALMNHELGERCNVPHFLARYYTLHSPLRRYYMFRNYMYLLERYLFSFPGFLFKLTITQIILVALVVVYDPDRSKSMRFMLRGIVDYCRRKHGAYLRDRE